MSPEHGAQYGRAPRWPTEENRLGFNESRWDRYGREDDGERSVRRSAPPARQRLVVKYADRRLPESAWSQ
jgi:hypothetical protein